MHKRFSPENSGNRFITLAPQGFGGDYLRFYATIGYILGIPIHKDISRYLRTSQYFAITPWAF
jgi:hypothetical protein